jgi:hypothetical protein
MGTLIQTKGTQRLARTLNNRFDESNAGLSAARTFVSAASNLITAFNDTTLNLLQISDRFIFQNSTAAATWPADGSDVLYPSTTMTSTSASASTSTLNLLFLQVSLLFPTILQSQQVQQCAV